jgi:DNA polymerase-3 subunit alpha
MELADIPLEDNATFESLSRGETTNVFQFESAGMTRYLRELKPTRVQDLYAMVALYRPGPLEQIPVYIHNKNNPQDISYLHPILKPILEDTYGVIVYQEQIMQLLQAIAGYTLGRAYVVLKAIGKKKRDLMAQEEPKFKAGCLENGLTQEQADTLWDLIQPFAGYSFNRPHSTLYGLLSYQTAYLKVNYPAQYMAAVLDAAAGSTEDVAKAVAECGRLGVEVLPPDVNQSHTGFRFQRHLDEHGTDRLAIRFGLSAIKNVGHGPVQSIIAAREQDGPFKNLEDFCARIERQALNKRVVEALIKCGAMDDMPGTRHQKLDILDQALAAGSEAQKAREAGQSSLFDLFGEDDAGAAAEVNVAAIPLPTTKETPEQKKEQLGWEKELLGMYVTEHPVGNALAGLDTSDTTPLSEAEDHIGEACTYIGLLTGKREITTRKGDTMLVGDLEDLESKISVVAFPRVYEQHSDLLVDDAVLRLTAKADNKRGSLQLIIDQCAALEPAEMAEIPAVPAAVQPEMDIEDMGAYEHTEATAEPAEPAPPPAEAVTAPEPAPSAEAAPEPSPAPTVPEIPTLTGPVRSIKARQRVNARSESEKHSSATNGHANGGSTNGSTNGGSANGGANGSANGSANGEQHNGDSGPTRDLRLHLPRTGDLTADTRRMQDLHELLRTHEGTDQVTLYLQRGQELVVLRPYYTVHVSHALLDELNAFLGHESVDLVSLE